LSKSISYTSFLHLENCIKVYSINGVVELIIIFGLLFRLTFRVVIGILCPKREVFACQNF